jgi:serine/threonine protein kinase
MPDPNPPGANAPLPHEDLLVQLLEQLERDGTEAADRFLAAHPDAAPHLREQLERLQRIGLVGGATDGSPQHPERLGDFRIVAPIGQGGMGVVYRAVQESLGREVALKVIRPDQLFFANSRERFRREVELVARMQHPGIVPVHAVGTDRGVPYFAMELVRGASLAECIARLEPRGAGNVRGEDLDAAIAAVTGDTEPRAPAELFAGSWVDVAVRIVRELADALEHAHRRGVLHRDVKPSNVMLTRDGRVLLLDFGLAGSDVAERLTRTGSALGSLAYMAPEVFGGSALRDARSDVYSLGVTCWELLALRLPYQHSDPVKLQAAAQTGARPRLSALDRAIPWDVETVVATAMDPDPARRYASASRFSGDLDNLLARRPIEASEPGAMLRVRRWGQRHPARAVATAVAAAALVVAPSLWAWQQARERDLAETQSRELGVVNTKLASRNAELDRVNAELGARNAELDRAKGIAEAESARATANFERLQLAVDTMLTKVGDESLKEIPRMELVRRDLLGEALRFYEGFLAQQPADARLRVEAARVRLKAADIHALLGDYARAGTEIDQGIADLAAAGELDAAARADLARARMRLATAKRLLGDLPAADAAATASIEAWQRAPANAPATLLGSGEAHLEASLIAADRGDLDGARALLDAPLAALAARRETGPADRVLAHLEARLLQRAAIWAFQSGIQKRDRTSGQPLVERAIALHEQADALWAAIAEPDFAMRSARAHGGVNLCLALQRLGRVEDALAAAAATVPRLEQLAADFPNSQRRRSELANARTNYAVLLAQLDHEDDSTRQLELATAAWRELLREAPGNDDYAIGLAHAVQTRATKLFYAGEVDAARVLFVEAGQVTDQALAVRPDNPTYRRVRRKVWESLAEVGIAAKDADAAATAARGLLEPALAPAEPALAAALVARCVPIAPAPAAGTRLRAEATALLRGVLDKGVTIADLRRNPTLRGQWDKPGFKELVEEIEPGGVR